MRDAHDVAYDQSARVASTNPAGDRPLALRRDRAEAVFDLKLESARAADGSALQTGSGQVNMARLWGSASVWTIAPCGPASRTRPTRPAPLTTIMPVCTPSSVPRSI